MTPTLVCLDFDGTLVDESGAIHPEDVRLLAEPAGDVEIVPATGRPLHAVRGTLRRHGLYATEPLGLPAVLENGAVVYEPGEVVRARFPFGDDLRDAFAQRMRAAPHITFLLFDTDTVHELWPSEEGDAMIARFGLETTATEPGEEIGGLTKLVCIAATDEPLRALAQDAAELPAEHAFSLPTVLEFTAAGVDKGNGLAALLESRPDRTRVVAVGDGENDLPLFAHADLAVAPAESPGKIRDAAGLVIDVKARGVLAPVLEALELS